MHFVYNIDHALQQDMPNLFAPRRVTTISLNANSKSFTSKRFNSNQYLRNFISNTTKLRNVLPNGVVECLDLQKFKMDTNGLLFDKCA